MHGPHTFERRAACATPLAPGQWPGSGASHQPRPVCRGDPARPCTVSIKPRFRTCRQLGVLTWLSRRQRKQGKSITLERVRQLRGALADLCHEWPLGMVRRDHLEQCLPQLHLSEPEYHTYRSIFRQCCTGRSMAARGDRASANMREYCTLLAALVPGTARDRLREFSQNFKGRLTEWKPGLEGTKFGLKTKTALRNMQRQAEPELRVEEIKTMFLCLLKLCEDKKNPLPPPSAASASSLRSSIDGSVGLSVAAESSTDGWTSRRPDIERDEA